MPSKNTIKIYVKDGIYHIYNRGVEKRDIFLDEQDYKIFLHYLKSYLLPFEQQEKAKLPHSMRFLKFFNFSEQISLLAYCLMPNHFHFLIKQLTERAIVELMKRLSNAYVEYFNRKYDRRGPLFQGRYRARLVEDDIYFLYVSSYIHRNPLELFSGLPLEQKIKKLREFQYSSYPDYLNKRNTPWIYKDEIMPIFRERGESIESGLNSYQKFVEEYIPEEMTEKDFSLET